MEKLIDVRDVAQMLGITIPGVYGMVHKKKIPAVKISARCLRFRPADIAAWISAKSQPAKVPGSPSVPVPHKRKRRSPASREQVDRVIRRAKDQILGK